MNTCDKLAQRAKTTHLCLGLDPDPRKIPLRYASYNDPILAFLQDVVKQTKDYVAAYKINTAFFEALGSDGWKTMEKLVWDIQYDGIPTIIDAKRCDIGNTAVAYARSVYEHLESDATTVLPFFGMDGISPFLAYPNKLTFVVVNSSNPGGQSLQKTVQSHLVGIARAGAPQQLGLVVPGTYPDVIEKWRDLFPDHWMLIPGIGAQGGSVKEAVKAAKHNFLINVSRAILYGEDGFAAEARKYRDEIQNATHT